MKKSTRTLVLALLVSLLLCTSVFADMGPKPALTVKLKNAPSELYYLDILAEDLAGSSLNDYMGDDERAALDQDLYAALLAAIPDGWHGCVSEGVHGAPMWGSLTADEVSGTTAYHDFGYHGVPETYRIAIVTESGEAWVSEVYTREVLQSSITIDFASKDVTVPPVWVGYPIMFLSTFVPTIAIEGVILLLFGYAWRKNYKTFLAVNFITQGLLHGFLAVTAMNSGVNFLLFLLLMLPAEIVIFIIEALLYSRYLTPRGKHPVLYALTANAASAGLGWLILDPVWRFVVSIL